MTEMVQGEGQDSSNFAPAPVTTPSTPSQAQTEGERTFRQSEVDKLVGRAKHEAVERYKSEGSMANRQQPHQQHEQPPYTPPYVPPQQQQYQGMSENEIRRIAAEEAQRSRNELQQEAARSSQEQDAQRIASEFFTKVGTGEGGIQEFEKIVNESGLDLKSIPYHVQLSNMVDNTREVMIDLIKNPSKLGSIQNLIDIDLRAGRQPRLALAEIKRLSQSIKDNAQGSNFKSPNEPLSQMRPSNAGTGTNGPLTTADYKRKYRV